MARVSAGTDLWLGSGLSDRDLGLLLPHAPYPKPHSPSFYPSELLAAKKGPGPESRRNAPFSAPGDSLLGRSLFSKVPESPPGSPPLILIWELSSSWAPSGSGGIPSRGAGALGGLQRGQWPKETGSTKGGIPGICRGALVGEEYLTYCEPCVAGEVSSYL